MKDNGVFPTRANDPLKCLDWCPRLRRNVILDVDNNCRQLPKYEVCSGCICLGLHDVPSEQLVGVSSIPRTFQGQK